MRYLLLALLLTSCGSPSGSSYDGDSNTCTVCYADEDPIISDYEVSCYTHKGICI